MLESVDLLYPTGLCLSIGRASFRKLIEPDSRIP